MFHNVYLLTISLVESGEKIIKNNVAFISKEDATIEKKRVEQIYEDFKSQSLYDNMVVLSNLNADNNTYPYITIKDLARMVSDKSIDVFVEIEEIKIYAIGTQL